MNTSIRDMKASDADLVVDYFANADPDYLKGMGADKSKLPDRRAWKEKIIAEINAPLRKKDLFYLIWQKEGEPFGHSNINKIEYGRHASMHLHIWSSDNRRHGIGLDLLKQTIPFYFEHFELEKLLCEPYALNPAPTKILKETGFEFVRAYDTIPGSICFYQTVNRYEMSRDRFYKVNKANVIQ